MAGKSSTKKVLRLKVKFIMDSCVGFEICLRPYSALASRISDRLVNNCYAIATSAVASNGTRSNADIEGQCSGSQ